MQAASLVSVYVLIAIVLQAIGFVVSRIIDYEWPAAGLMTFLILLMAAYGIAWPIAVWITEWAIVRLGHKVEKADPRAT